MKFYKRYPGDIMKKTSGLSMAQMGAYDRLIDWCYANEQAIDPDEVFRITHAETPQDRRDVEKVLTKFFTRDAEGYRQERIEEVIAEALPRIEAAKANGLKGGRPLGSRKKPTGLISETQDEPNDKAIQSQSLLSPSEKKTARKRAADPPCPDDVAADVWRDWCDLRRKKRADVSPTTVAGARSEAGKAGLTLEAFLGVWCLRGSQGLLADWLKPHERQAAAPAQTFRERDAEIAAARVHQMTGGLVSAKPPGAINGHVTEVDRETVCEAGGALRLPLDAAVGGR